MRASERERALTRHKDSGGQAQRELRSKATPAQMKAKTPVWGQARFAQQVRQLAHDIGRRGSKEDVEVKNAARDAPCRRVSAQNHVHGVRV